MLCLMPGHTRHVEQWATARGPQGRGLDVYPTVCDGKDHTRQDPPSAPTDSCPRSACTQVCAAAHTRVGSCHPCRQQASSCARWPACRLACVHGAAVCRWQPRGALCVHLRIAAARCDVVYHMSSSVRVQCRILNMCQCLPTGAGPRAKSAPTHAQSAGEHRHRSHSSSHHPSAPATAAAPTRAHGAGVAARVSHQQLHHRSVSLAAGQVQRCAHLHSSSEAVQQDIMCQPDR